MKFQKDITVKPVLISHSKRRQQLVFKTDYRLMQVQKHCRMLQHSAILSTLFKLPFVIKIFGLFIFEWPLTTGLTVCQFSKNNNKTMASHGSSWYPKGIYDNTLNFIDMPLKSLVKTPNNYNINLHKLAMHCNVFRHEFTFIQKHV